MGGHQVRSTGTGDDGYDEDGYDESQRAEILEATRDGPSDGNLLTDLAPDLGDDAVEDEAIDDLDMESREVGDADSSVDMGTEDQNEDDAQDAFEGGTADADTITDAEDVALRP